MRSQVLLVVAICTCVSELEAVSLSSKRVDPDFISQTGTGGNGVVDISGGAGAELTLNDLPGAIDGKKWQKSSTQRVEKAASVWSGNNWAKRNVFDGKHMNQAEAASGIVNQFGSVRNLAGGAATAKEDKKGAFSASRQYVKTRNEGTSQATLTGKAGSIYNRYSGQNWADASSHSRNRIKDAEGSLSGLADVASENTITSSFAKRGRTQVLEQEGKIKGDGQVTRDFGRDAGSLTADAASETGTDGANIGATDFDSFDAEKVTHNGPLGDISKSVEVGAATDPLIGRKLDITGNAAGRLLYPMSAVADGNTWGKEGGVDGVLGVKETARINPMSHADWVKYEYYAGGDCVAGQQEGTGGCRWKCPANDCTAVSSTCHATKTTADPADGNLGTGNNAVACSKADAEGNACYGATACLSPFA